MLNLTGGYTMVSGERDGKPLPPDHIADTIVRFTADTVKVVHTTRGDAYAASYTLDGNNCPCKITMTATAAPDSGSVALGLLEKQGDTIKLIYALPGNPCPTEFKTKAGELLFVMTNFNK